MFAPGGPEDEVGVAFVAVVVGGVEGGGIVNAVGFNGPDSGAISSGLEAEVKGGGFGGEGVGGGGGEEGGREVFEFGGPLGVVAMVKMGGNEDREAAG